MDYALSGLDYCRVVLVGLSPYAIDVRAFSPEIHIRKTLLSLAWGDSPTIDKEKIKP